MDVTIEISTAHVGAEWWASVRKAARPPRELHPLIAGEATAVEVAVPRARQIRTWCAALPGWDREAAPLTFAGLVGRPPSPRRSGGATRVTVWLAADERAVLEDLAEARGQSLADVLRTSALQDAQRSEAPSRRRRPRTKPRRRGPARRRARLLRCRRRTA